MDSVLGLGSHGELRQFDAEAEMVVLAAFVSCCAAGRSDILEQKREKRCAQCED